jgi:broad specificity phosphatase PhoE
MRAAVSVALAAIVTLLIGAGGPAASQPDVKLKPPRTILIIRHAEKTDDPDDLHLSKTGQERAEHLHELFKASPSRPKPFPPPDFIFAARNTKQSHRPVDTVTPLAKARDLAVNTKFRNQALDDPPDPYRKSQRDLSEEMLQSGKYAGKTVLISWHHGTIPDLARLLGAADCPKKWRGAAFDRVWQITYDERGQATFADLPQQLLPGDSAK